MLKFLLALFVAIGFSSCAQTKILCEDPYADIYMDEKWIGAGETSIGSIGPPRSAKLEAKRGKKVVGKASMKRRFTFKTVLLGMFSYYTGFYWGWYFPPEVIIQKNQEAGPDKSSPNLWNNPGQSIWMKPLMAQ